MADYNVIPVETAVAADAITRAVAYHRSIAELATASDSADAQSDESNTPTELARASDAVVIAMAYGKTITETPTGVDEVEIRFRLRPRYVHVHHVIGKPAYCLSSYEDYRGLVGPRHSVVLNRGRAERVSTRSFEAWPAERQRLAYMMEKGVILVHEDYLGTQRELTAEQVDSYVSDNSPYVTWVQHRVITGAPVAPDATPPDASSLGTRCSGFERVLIKADIVGGVSPDVDIAVWYRSPTATDKGAWVLAGSAVDLAHDTELPFPARHGELFIQLTDQDGDPTEVTFYISGTTAS